MLERLQFYIDGKWVNPCTQSTLDIINPATEKPFARISLGTKKDVDLAVNAARRAFKTFSKTSKEERISVLEQIIVAYQNRLEEMGEAISKEMGAPLWLAMSGQAGSGLAHFKEALNVLKDYSFTEIKGTTALVKEPIGVCGLITPWNWPINQIACKVAPAIAAGCTVVLKPSEVAPLNAMIFAEIMHEALVPAGVFNLVNGDGATVGEAISSHPGIDMVSFTGSTRAGIAVAKAAADSVKRVTQELGGKSPNIILEDANLEKAVTRGVFSLMNNSGQSCNAPSRMFVPRAKQHEVIKIAQEAIKKVHVTDPSLKDAPRGSIGPVANENQFNKIQKLIKKGIDEGAELIAGGPDRPEDKPVGYFVRPTIFANVRNDMTIAQEEIFGPVLCIIPYETQEEAIEMANDTPYGLSAYVQSDDLEHAREVALQLRAGNVHLNGAYGDSSIPFGGFKQSGNGREMGKHGFEEYLETKAVIGYEAKQG